MGSAGRFCGGEFVEFCWVGEGGADEIDVEAAFDVPHGDAEDGAEIWDVGAVRFGGWVFVEEGSGEERVEAGGEVAGGVGGFGEGDEVVEGEEGGIFVLGAVVSGQVWDSRWMMAESWAWVGREKKKEKRKDNAETQRTLRGAEKR